MKHLPNHILGRQAEELIGEGQTVKMRFTGASMLPYLRPGADTVLLAPAGGRELKAGMVVFFRYNDHYIVHRIVKRRGDELYIQGDGNLTQYEKIATDEVIAVVEGVIRPGGRETSPLSACARAYWAAWLALRPIRKYILAVYRRTSGRKYR